VDVGIVGLGAMGLPVAGNLRRAGFSIVGYDTEPSRAASLQAIGGLPCDSVEDVARTAQVVLTLLPSVGALEDVVRRIAAVAQAEDLSGIVVAEMSTLSEATKRRARDSLAPYGIDVLDSPVSGTAAQVASGDLVVYVGGNPDAIAVCRPVFEGTSRAVFATGEFGSATRTKLVANLLVGVHIVAAAEALALARRAGLDLSATLAALTAGAGSSRMLEIRGPMMASAVFTPPSMRVELFKKDELLIEELAQALGSPTPLFDIASRLFRRAEREGHGQEDTASVFLSLAEAGRSDIVDGR
jgi:putative dehydrogenase